MASLKDLRNKIKSIKSIQQVTNAMKMVAAAKLRKSQDNMEKARPYTNSIEEMISHLIPDIDRLLEPTIATRSRCLLSSSNMYAFAWSCSLVYTLTCNFRYYILSI